MANHNDIKNNENNLSEHESAVALSKTEATQLAKTAALILDNKKAEKVNILKLPESAVIADCFVVATGTSSTHIKALADELEFQLHEQLAQKPGHIEGFGNDSWILMDYNTVIIHIFTKEARDFYNLERLWNDAEQIEYNN